MTGEVISNNNKFGYYFYLTLSMPGKSLKEIVKKSIPVKVLIFNGLSFMLVYILMKVSHGDMCNPGLGDIVFIFLFIPAGIVLFFYLLVKSIRGGNSFRNALLIHILIWAAIIYWYNY